ncbi:unnamed protein product [Mytilus edulis]|uniref:Uncharacterized protein n=1 Tax=Mytilus edulis TaxID=6550 RepID=A0A8S3R195_MYTED|nr:unnamed protein product [Mytilus edulis]
MSVVSVVDVLFILVLIVVYLNNHHWNVEHSQNDRPQNPNGNGHERRQGNVKSQSILDRIHRVPVLDNKRNEDILTIPSARYIFVFVDFNERNVILENPGQDLGDKKLVTVQAAQKIGADVFVTYVRDRGSNQLLPGNLYNQELSAFTSHFSLKGIGTQPEMFQCI